MIKSIRVVLHEVHGFLLTSSICTILGKIMAYTSHTSTGYSLLKETDARVDKVLKKRPLW